jgi:hypothetical protein
MMLVYSAKDGKEGKSKLGGGCDRGGTQGRRGDSREAHRQGALGRRTRSRKSAMGGILRGAPREAQDGADCREPEKEEREGVRLRRSIWSSALVYAAMIPASHAADKRPHETCFVGVQFGQDRTFAVTLENEGKYAEDVTIDRYSEHGERLATAISNVGAKAKLEVRLDVSSVTPAAGWIRVITRGNDVRVSSMQELLDGNTLRTLPSEAVFRHPLSEGAIRVARRYSIPHRYTYDLMMLGGGVAFVFVNLSDYPVAVGMCQADYPGCENSTPPRTVPPLASTAFEIDPLRRFGVVESTPGYSAASPVEFQPGFTKTFGSESTITFEPVK